MTAAEFVAVLQEAIDMHSDDGEYFEDVISAYDFESHGVMTYNNGLVVRLKSGDEFQVTVVQSEHGDDDDQEGEDV